MPAPCRNTSAFYDMCSAPHGRVRPERESTSENAEDLYPQSVFT